MKSEDKTLMEVEVNHDYYEDGKCDDFIFKPTVSCRQLLKQYGLLFSNTENGFSLSQVVDMNMNINPAQSVKPIEPGIEFNFLMRKMSPLFETFTDFTIPASIRGRAILCLDNYGLSEDDDLNREILPLKPEIFNYSFVSRQNKAVDLFVTDHKGRPVQNWTLYALKKVKRIDGKIFYFYSTQINLSGHEPGIYSIDVPGENIHERRYVDNALLCESGFGIVKIVSDYFNYWNALRYRIRFNRKPIVSLRNINEAV